jgi:hypothetical protein
MFVDQITPHLPKGNEEVNVHVKRVQVMLDATMVADPTHNQEDGDRGHDDDHRRSPWGDSSSSITPPEGHGEDNRDLCDIIRGRDACGRVERRHRDRVCDELEQHDERDRDYYGPYYDHPHRQRSPEGGHIPGGINAYSRDLKQVRWPVNFKTSGIEKYDGSTNPSEWHEVYQLTIEAAGGDSYIMTNYLLVCLSSSAKIWLLRLLVGSVQSWNHLCRLFASNFRTTCA